MLKLANLDLSDAVVDVQNRVIDSTSDLLFVWRLNKSAYAQSHVGIRLMCHNLGT